MTTEEETSKTRVNSHQRHSSDLLKMRSKRTHLQLQHIATGAAKENNTETLETVTFKYDFR